MSIKIYKPPVVKFAAPKLRPLVYKPSWKQMTKGKMPALNVPKIKVVSHM